MSYSSPKPLPYAPTPYSYTPNTSLSATINLDQEVKLSTTSQERDLHDSLAEIYSIIITLDGLEKAYDKDSLPEPEYTDLCNRLLKQYKSNLSDETVANAFVDLETFKREWDLDCPKATKRLKIMLPDTAISTHPMPMPQPSYSNSPLPSSPTPMNPHHSTTPGIKPASGQQILAATENFITLLDALKLGIASKDQLHPLLADLIQSVNKVTEGDFEGRGVIVKWLIRLNGMKAREEVGEEEARELGFEIEGAYRGFKGVLS